MADVRSQPTLGDYLIREGIITQAQLNRALEEQMATSRSIGRILVDMGFLSEAARMNLLQKRFGFDLIRLKDVKVDPALLTMVPHSFAEKHRVVPVRQEEGPTLVVAMEDPSDILIIDAIKNQIGMRIKPVVASRDDLQVVLNQYPSAEQVLAARPEAQPVQHGLLYTILKYGAFPVLALLPLVLFFMVLSVNFHGWAHKLQVMHDEGSLTRYDLILYFLLSWGSWTMILFEINGLIFGNQSKDAEEEA